MNCLVKKLTETAILPKYAEPGSIGADVYSDESVTIFSGGRAAINTGISIAPLDHGGYVRVAARSGLSIKGIDVGAGVIDNSYRGPVKIILVNNSKEDFVINQGDKIAQLVFEVASIATFKESSELPTSERGQNGFGSTGTK